jgi:hypothetical protein
VGETGNTSSLTMTCFASLLLSHHPEGAFSIESHSLLDSSVSQTHEDLKDYSFTVILTPTNTQYIFITLHTYIQNYDYITHLLQVAVPLKIVTVKQCWITVIPTIITDKDGHPQEHL